MKESELKIGTSIQLNWDIAFDFYRSDAFYELVLDYFGLNIDLMLNFNASN